LKNMNKESNLSELKQAFADAYDEGEIPDLFGPKDLIPGAMGVRSEDKEKQTLKCIKMAADTATDIGTILHSKKDLDSVIALQVGLSLKIADIWRDKIAKSELLQILDATVTASSKKKGFKVTDSTATLAGAVTYGFGHACNKYFKSDKTIEFGEVGDVFNDKCKEYKEIKCK